MGKWEFFFIFKAQKGRICDELLQFKDKVVPVLDFPLEGRAYDEYEK